ncbi:hypothetical protein M0R04_04970 [Candidatus Dojkabacteria bacterium]|jgi:broad-specificity NMP kinase|nr:hypothetical protein [Candidatus Dojkabacteria bacterium]
MENLPKITVTGCTGTGKTSIAYLINQILLENGILSKIIGCEDESPVVIMNTYKARIDAISKKYNYKPIIIETIQEKRRSI